MRLVIPVARLAALTAALLALCLPPGVSPAQSGGATRVHFGVVAEEQNEPDRMLRAYGGLIGELRARLRPSAIEVGEIAIARDLEDLSQRLRGGEVDFVIETVFPTLVLQERSRSLDPALVVFRRGQREYRSVFFTREQSPVRSLRDLRGRILVLQALRSTSAFALPKAEIERTGLTLVPADDLRAHPEDVRYVLAGAEINQAIWVLHGKGVAGAFNEGDWAALPQRVRSQLRIFHETAPLVRGLLSFRADLEPRVRRALEETLLKLADDEAGRVALAAASGVSRLEPLTAQDRRALGEWAPILRPSRRR